MLEIVALDDPVENTNPSIAPVARPAGASRGRASAKKGSGIGAVIKMALGGLLAVPIAATILSLVGRPLPIDLGFFPFQGDSVGTSSVQPFDSTPSRRAAPPRPSRSPETDSDMTPPNSRVLTPEVPAREAFAGGTDDVSATEEALAEIQDSNATMKMPGLKDLADAAGPETPETTTIENEKAELAMPAVEVPALEIPALTPELTVAIDDANTILSEAIEIKESGAIDTKVFGNAYRGIAEVASLLDDATADLKEVVALLDRVASSPLAGMYSQVGRQWLVAKSRKTDGILLIGEMSDLIGEMSDSDSGSRINFDGNQSLAVQYEGSLPEGRVAAFGRIQKNSSEPSVELSVVRSLD